jgi:hypothetical protein
MILWKVQIGSVRETNNLRIVSRKRRFSTIVQPIAADVVMGTKEECHSHELMGPSIPSGRKTQKHWHFKRDRGNGGMKAITQSYPDGLLSTWNVKRIRVMRRKDENDPNPNEEVDEE